MLRWLQWQGSSRWRTLVEACEAQEGEERLQCLELTGNLHQLLPEYTAIPPAVSNPVMLGPASCFSYIQPAARSCPLTFILSVPTRSTVVKPGLRKRLVISLTWGQQQGEEAGLSWGGRGELVG